MVKIVLPDVPPVTCSGKVIWTRLEPMAVGQPLGYRAGVRFSKALRAALPIYVVFLGTIAFAVLAAQGTTPSSS